VSTSVKLTVNGAPRALHTDDPAMPLLYALRDQLGLRGPHFGCGLAQCGACTVHFDGTPLRCCVMPISAVAGADIVTLEGLGTAEKPHPLQQAFIDEQAAQCGYCINGMIMQAAALLATTKRPTEDQVRQALAGNLCKCGTHVRILRAVMRAANQMWELGAHA
jgi:nicotinate dehydrogenase subunit A